MQDELIKYSIVDQCKGCGKIVNEFFCSSYLFPYAKWRIGNCPLATHIPRDDPGQPGKKLNPIKASKKSIKQGGL